MSDLSEGFEQFVHRAAGENLRAMYYFEEPEQVNREYMRDDVERRYDEENLSEVVDSVLDSLATAEEREDLLDADYRGDVEIYDEMILMTIPSGDVPGERSAAVLSLDQELIKGSNLGRFMRRGYELLE